MRSEIVNFRATPTLAKAIRAAAKQSAVKPSEFIRQAVEDRLATFESEPGSSMGADPFDKLAAAARGSLQAQRDLAQHAAQVAFARDPETGEPLRDPELTLREGLTFARLAAAHGHFGDQGVFVSLVALLGEVVGEENCAEEMAEALARLALVADSATAGADFVADNLLRLFGDAPPNVVALAKEYSNSIKDEVVA